jgi:hypothetical protein
VSGAEAVEALGWAAFIVMWQRAVYWKTELRKRERRQRDDEQRQRDIERRDW